MISLFLYFETGIKPELINASHARNLCGIKTKRGENAKENVLTYVQQHDIFSKDKWEYKKTGKVKDWMYDMADAYIVSRAGYEILRSK